MRKLSEEELSQRNSKEKQVMVESESVELLPDEPELVDTTVQEKKKKNIFIKVLLIVMIILLLLLCLKSCGLNKMVSSNPTQSEEDFNIVGEDWDGKSPVGGKDSVANSETIDVAGYSNIFLSDKNKTIDLVNPKGNTVYFKYVITDENQKELASTDYIEPNKMVSVNLFDSLEKGEHNLSFTISTFDIETHAPCNGTVQNVLVTVE